MNRGPVLKSAAERAIHHPPGAGTGFRRRVPQRFTTVAEEQNGCRDLEDQSDGDGGA